MNITNMLFFYLFEDRMLDYDIPKLKYIPAILGIKKDRKFFEIAPDEFRSGMLFLFKVRYFCVSTINLFIKLLEANPTPLKQIICD